MDEIYRQYMPKIYRFIYYMVYDAPLAEDLTQETFIKVWKYMPKFDSKLGTVQAILYTTARNLVIDNQRKKKESSLEAIGGENIEASENVEAKYFETETQKEVGEILKKLPKEDRELVIMRFFEDMSFTEVAKITGKPEGALRVKIHRILKTLKNEIK